MNAFGKVAPEMLRPENIRSLILWMLASPREGRFVTQGL
jgi:hypothetical protein